jgi:myosin-3
VYIVSSNRINVPEQIISYIIHIVKNLNQLLQMCEGGTVVDLVNSILLQNKKMKEEHIGYILRELIRVCILNNIF